MKNSINDNRPGRRSYAVLDVELLNALEEFESYKALDRRAADLRWPFRRVCAASLLTFSIDEEGLFEFGHLDSWAGDDEAALLRALFNRLHLLPDHELITWGGLSCDLRVIHMGACEHELRMPKQLIHGAREQGRWCHRDLALEFKGGSGVYVHLAEVACRLRLPVKFADQASMVPTLMASGKLRRVAAIAEADVITTALVMCDHLQTQGELAGAKGAQICLLQNVVKLRPEARYRDYLNRVAKRLMSDAMSAIAAFIASAA